MERMERRYLNQGDKIYLSAKPGTGQGSFCEIMEKMGEGASCVCYQASFEGTEGVLKEFYPVDQGIGRETEYYFLKRTASNQLAAIGEAMEERFRDRCEEFISGYKKLSEARKKDAKNKILNNYIPVYRILYGEEEGKRRSVYIWSANDKTGETFEQYLEGVRNNPKDYPVRKVFHILNTLLTLTDCIKALHTAGLLHLDIKPSNFLVPYNSMFDINPYSISLFDVDTLYSVGNRYSALAGTPGFVAPEVKRGRGENRSDIFSLGAMLFYSLMIPNGSMDGFYQQENYEYLDQCVQDSELLNAGEVTSNVFFQACISHILKNCLAKRPKDRYQNCEELMEDLKKALTFIVPTVMNENLADTSKKLAVLEEEKVSEETVTTKIQNLLYKRPLYEASKKEDEEIHVLVLGAGTYGQKFIDLCLQAGQMRGKKVHISAVSAHPERDKEIYLQFRPALCEFVDVDGEGENTEKEWYGKLDFMPVPLKKGRFLRTAREENKEGIKAILKEKGWEGNVQYVFIALSDEDFNQEIKEEVSHVLGGRSCPICTYEKDCDEDMDPFLKQMAFLTHISWKNSLQIDMEEAYKEFKVRYNYESSYAYALSIKYKLESVGILIEDTKKAAAEFEEIVKDKEILHELTALEHRRWVMEKVTGGWSAPRGRDGEIDYEGCVERTYRTGRTYDKAAKLHPCIVRSSKKRVLDRWEKEDWEKETALEGLDELDRVSVRLHQLFHKRGEKHLYKEYKANDQILVERIPFLLTYRPDPHMVVCLDSRGRKNAFASAASPSMLAPARITYVTYCDEEGQLGRLSEKMTQLLSYYRNRGMHGGIALIAGVKKDISEEGKNRFAFEMEQSGTDEWTWISCENEEEMIEQCGKILAGKRIDLVDLSTELFENEKWQMAFAEQMKKSYPSFTFRFVDKCFTDLSGCEYLSHIRESSCIRGEDMARLKGMDSGMVKDLSWQPSYEIMWNVYKNGIERAERAIRKSGEGRNLWNGLCSRLKEYGQKRQVFTEFVVDQERIAMKWMQDGKELEIQAPSKAAQILNLLKEALSCGNQQGITLSLHEDGNREKSKLVWEDMSVREFVCSSTEEKELLSCLSEAGILKNLQMDGERASFSYASYEAKELLTEPDRIFEAYLAMKMKKSGRFDLVQSGFTCTIKEKTFRISGVLSKGFFMEFVITDFDHTKEDRIKEVKRHFGNDVKIRVLHHPDQWMELIS